MSINYDLYTVLSKITAIPFRTSDVLLFLITLIILYITQFYYRYFTRQCPLPGPIPLPVFGNAHQSIGLGFNNWLISMHKKYGDIYEVHLAGKRMIVVCRADLLDNMNVSSTKTKYFDRFKSSEGLTEYGLDNTALVFNNDYKSWQLNRQFFNQAMMTPSFNYQAVEWTKELWEEMESYWNNIGENRELDLSKWMKRFTNDIIFRIATGIKNGSVASYYNALILENDDSFVLNEKEKGKIEESNNLIKAIETYIDGIFYFMTFNKFMRRYVPIVRGKGKSLLKNKDYLFSRLYNIVKERRTEIDNTPLDQPLRHDMLTSLITVNTSRDISAVNNVDVDLLRPMTDREIFGTVLDSLCGGTDSTANSLCFIIYHIGKYPEVKKRLQQELDEVLGKDLTKTVTYEDLEKLQYCEAVIKEVTRHIPVAFVSGRVSSEDDNFGGYNFPKGTEFFMLYSAVMKHENYWTDPEKFDPDRFYKVEESDKYLLEKQKIKNSFTMFGEGLRQCPGRKLAMIELKWLLSSIYRKYDIQLADINAPLKYTSGSINACGKLNVKIKPRKF